ncbi:YybH family protein [Mobilicoccus massiliensis]|uniref:YybH family protein n=1 Tax=Mobilicoccus massiliensis TaxID=1522310 RepID=UPI0006949009|nr:nuclear transport factor 2 family protein [Mobilicoccus massiliensis]
MTTSEHAPIDIDTTVDGYCTAIANCDAEAVLALCADDIRVFDANGAWEYDGRNAWATRVREWLGNLSGQGECRLDSRRVTAAGDLAVVEGLVYYVADMDGERVACTTRLTQAWRREGERWLLAHEHTSFPLDDETGAALPPPA